MTSRKQETVHAASNVNRERAERSRSTSQRRESRCESPDTREKIVEKVEAESEGEEIGEGFRLLTSYLHMK